MSVSSEQPGQIVFRQGMSAADRVALRAQIEGRFVARAREEAAQQHVSYHCLSARHMAQIGATADQVKAEHVKCLAEIAGGGCLDECHDQPS